MALDLVTLARLLSLAALLAATIQYAELTRHRTLRRADAIERAEFERLGLAGLVRVLLVDSAHEESRPRASKARLRVAKAAVRRAGR